MKKTDNNEKVPLKVYLAGKVAGDPNYKAKFEKAAEAIRETGNIPLYSSWLPKGLHTEEYMRICFALIDIADIVLFLPDSKDSPGAKVELEYCKYIKKQYGGLKWKSGKLLTFLGDL